MSDLGPENSEVPNGEQAGERMYPVKLQKNLFLHIAEGLAPVYKSELNALREDGAMKPLEEFHHSPFGSLMTRVLDAVADPTQLPDNIEFGLSDKDMSVIDEKIRTPQNAGDLLLNREMMSKLKEDYSSAKLNERLRSFPKKLKSIFKR